MLRSHVASVVQDGFAFRVGRFQMADPDDPDCSSVVLNSQCFTCMADPIDPDDLDGSSVLHMADPSDAVDLDSSPAFQTAISDDPDRTSVLHMADPSDPDDPDSSSVGQQVSPAENQLLKRLDASMLRGVSLSVCLSGWGKHFSSNPSQSMYQVQARDYGLSFQVSKFDHFLSHDWGTVRSSKLLVMLIYFNSRAASLAAMACGTIVGLCREVGSFQDIVTATDYSTRTTVLASLLPQLVFVFFLCFWQRVSGFFRRPRVVFLDKLCIAQHNLELKAQGIWGLASFVDHSEELIISWSSRYFTRLWCCLEVAAFLRRRNAPPMVVLPVTTAWLKLGLIVFSLGMVAALQISRWAAIPMLRPPQSVVILSSAADVPLVIVAIAVCSWTGYFILGWWIEVQDVNRQLREFSVKLADCFCCANHHQHPETGQAVLCDRKLVFGALKEWYGGLDEEHLDKFDQEVRTTLLRKVEANFGASMKLIMPQSTLLLLMCGIFSPLLCDSVAWMRSLWLQEMEPMLKFWRCIVGISRFYAMPLIAFPVAFQMGQLVAIQLGTPLMKVSSRLLAAISVGLVTAVLAIFIHWSLNSLPTVMGADFWPLLASAWLLWWWILVKCFT